MHIPYSSASFIMAANPCYSYRGEGARGREELREGEGRKGVREGGAIQAGLGRTRNESSKQSYVYIQVIATNWRHTMKMMLIGDQQLL